MALDDKLKALQALEVGNVEKAITGIERVKLEIETTADNLEQGLMAYNSLIQEKLPKIIGNIVLMGAYVVELGKFYNDGLWIDKEGDTIRLKKDIPHCSFRFRLNFNGDASLSEISLVRDVSSRKHWYSFRKKWSCHRLIRSDTAEDFTAKYLGLIIPNLNEKGYSEFAGLPMALNEVPDDIRRAYEIKKKDQKLLSRNIQSHNGALRDLDVSDFS